MTYAQARKIVGRKPFWLVRNEYNAMVRWNKNNLTESNKLELLALEIILFHYVNGKDMPSTISQTLQVILQIVVCKQQYCMKTQS